MALSRSASQAGLSSKDGEPGPGDRAGARPSQARAAERAPIRRFGVESYWIVVPEVKRPELIAFELRDGRYRQVAHVTGGKPFRAERPFPVEVIPARLVARLLPD
jgi:hypothetical protein